MHQRQGDGLTNKLMVATQLHPTERNNGNTRLVAQLIPPLKWYKALTSNNLF